MKELDSAVVDDSLSLADVMRNATNERGRSVQSKSYDVMYSATKSHRNEGRKEQLHNTIHFIVRISLDRTLLSTCLSVRPSVCQTRAP